MKNFLFLLILFVCHLSLHAQQNTPSLVERAEGQLLLQFVPDSDPATAIAILSRQTGAALSLLQPVAAEWNIWLIGFEENSVNAANLLQKIRQSPLAQVAQWNHRATDRGIEPNDPNWNQQDDMVLINAPEAWTFSTGGVMTSRDSIKGDTIVAAVLEKGILFTHPDLAPNRWYNRAEIPNNNIDDDLNGARDDYGGWNPRHNNDSLGTKANHGTGVAGIMGAKGNNGVGISGVNWDVKLMGLTNVEFESEIIAGYAYVARMRRLYNQTQGQKGAFVVTSNSSFGLDNEKAADHPLWCAMYDSMGVVGIISVGATSNSNVNVEMQGDMPTTCNSEFLITVTNTDGLGNKIPSAGYGATSIDLGAPGDATYTTANIGNNTPGYANLGGTSSATPHVSGAVALLYSIGCDRFTNDALSDPVTCARRVRDVILTNTEANGTLSGKTTTGGYLDIRKAIDGILNICDGAVGSLDFLDVRYYAVTNRYQVFYQTSIFEPHTFRIHNTLGQLIYEEEIRPLGFQSNYVEFDSSKLSHGMYVMSISRGKAVKSRQFIKY